MSISDEMMWRYYELLTDLQMSEIEFMKREAHPMNAKKELARRIVTDFHSPDAATRASEDWAKQFQKHETPDVIEHVTIPIGRVCIGAGTQLGMKPAPPDVQVLSQDSGLDLAIPVRTDKLLAESGLAESASDGARKIKQKAVEIDGEVVTKPKLAVPSPSRPLTIRVGRSMKVVAIV
jgi:tyrosyl-tRNA synthetase